MLQLYNSLSNQVETFTSLHDKNVTLYVCGITPYDTTHLGHAFTYTTFDALIRYLRFQGYTVDYTQNVTDIDDDILKKAREVGKDWKELGNFWTERFLNDLQYLNILPPTHYVKATDSIPTIIKIVKQLVKNGFAYEQNGTVYFRVKKFTDYGKLSKYSYEKMVTLLKERGGNPNDPAKEYPLDFILWQRSLEDEPFWNSPWGKGRPGWHIECSAMNYDYLGEQIDIHGGGGDLIYPHHESEIAQSETVTGKKPFASLWMHTAMLRYQGEKMSKSLGNLVMVSQLKEKYSGNAIRYVLLSHHYRTSWEFQDNELREAQEVVTKIEQIIKPASQLLLVTSENQYMKRFREFMNDDLQTPHALSLLSELYESSNAKNVSEEDKQALYTIFSTLGFII